MNLNDAKRKVIINNRYLNGAYITGWAMIAFFCTTLINFKYITEETMIGSMPVLGTSIEMPKPYLLLLAIALYCVANFFIVYNLAQIRAVFNNTKIQDHKEIISRLDVSILSFRDNTRAWLFVIPASLAGLCVYYFLPENVIMIYVLCCCLPSVLAAASSISIPFIKMKEYDFNDKPKVKINSPYNQEEL